MKLGKAIAAAVGTAAAVGAAVYAKRRLDETQTPLKKQRSVTVWKSGGKVQHKEVIRKPVSEREQTDILKSRIDKATRQYEQLADRNNDTESEPADNTENEQEIAPVNFTFVQSEEDGNTGVSFDRVFDHFNRLEKPVDEENKTVDNADNNIVDTITANQTAAAESVDETKADAATDDEYEAAAISAVMTMQEEQESEAEQMKLEKGIMTPDPIASAVRELADIQPVTDGANDVSVERMSVDESIFDLSASEPVEEAVKAFEEISEQAEEQPEIAEETAKSASALEEEFAQAMAENAPVSEPVEEAVKAFEEITEQAEEQPEIAEETAESASTLEEEFTQAMAENVPVSEPVEEAVKELEEITEQAEEQPAIVEETAESASTLEEEFAQAMAENVPVSEPVEEAVKAFEEMSEQAEEQPEIAVETAESSSTLEEEFTQAMAENVPVNEPVEEAVKAFEEMYEQAEEQPEIAEETAESASTLEEEFAQAMAENVPVSEPVEEAVKAFEEMSEQAEEQPEIAEETAESASTLEEEFAQATAENIPVSEPVEEAVKELEEITEQSEEQPEIAEKTAESSSTLEEEFTQAMAENVPVNEPVEEAVKAFEEMSEQAEEQPEIAEETAESASTLEEEFAQAMTENAPVSEPVEEAVKAFEEIAEPVAVEIAESQAEDMLFENIDDDLSDDMASVRTAESVDDAVKEFSDLIGEPEAARSMINADAEYDDDLEQTGDIPAEENSTAEEQPVIQTVPEAQTEKTRTMDFFDLPDEAYAPVQTAEEKHDDNVAEVEDLFGDLLADDEPVEKKTFTDPSEVFSMFDTADVGQDDFDKYNDEKIEEENEKKKTSDAKKYIAQDIADNIASFAQLLEPLNAIKENKIRSKSGILFDWEMRIQSLIGDLPIKTYWRNNFRNYEIWTDEKCMEKAGELLAMLELVGIVRDKAKEVVVDKDTLDFYSAQSEHLNNDFHIGETVVVTRPCWRINGKPARKGEIAKKAPFAEFSRKKVSPLETMLRENSCSDGDVNIPVTEDNFCTYDREIPYVKQAIADGFCKCAVRRMEDGGALAFFYEVVAEGENEHYSPCTLRFEVNIDKNAKVVGRFRSEKV